MKRIVLKGKFIYFHEKETDFQPSLLPKSLIDQPNYLKKVSQIVSKPINHLHQT